MSQLSSLTVFSYTARETFVSEKTLYYNEATKPGKNFCPASSNSTRGNCACQDIAALHSGKGGTALPGSKPPLRLLSPGKGPEKAALLCPPSRTPAPRSCLLMPRPPPAEQSPATVPAPLSTAPAPAALPAQLTAAGAERRPARRAQVRSAARERKGCRRRAVRHLPWPLGGRLGAGAAPGAGSGGRWATGPAQPGPAHAVLRLKCRSQGSLVGM